MTTERIDQLKSLNTKIGNGASQGNSSLGIYAPGAVAEISIADLISIAQPFHSEIFSRDVANAVGSEYTAYEKNNARYSLIMGEAGAANLRNAEDVLRNLGVAREMLAGYVKSNDLLGKVDGGCKRVA